MKGRSLARRLLDAARSVLERMTGPNRPWRRPVWWPQPMFDGTPAKKPETAPTPSPNPGTPPPSTPGTPPSIARTPPDSRDFGSARRSQLLNALSQISPEHREILVLRDVHGLSYAAIARRLGVPEDAVADRLYQARRAFLEPWAALRPAASTLTSLSSRPILSKGATFLRRRDFEELEDGGSPELGPGRVGAAGPGPGYARSP